MKNTTDKNLPFVIALVLLNLFAFLSVVSIQNKRQTKQVYWIEYYEAKLDWFEMQYGIDFDNNSSEFLEWFMQEHQEAYEYLKDKGE